jgi:hypothetical protein
VAALAPAPERQDDKRGGTAGDHQVGPRRPAGIAALDQRVDKQSHRQSGDRGAEEVEVSGGKLSTALGIHGLTAALVIAAGLGTRVNDRQRTQHSVWKRDQCQ